MAILGDGGWWQSIETAIIAIVTGTLAVIAFIWGILWKVNSMGEAIVVQRRDFDASVAEVAKLKTSLGRLHEEHYRLREVLAAQPTKQDLNGLEERLGKQLDRIASSMAK